MYAFLFFSFEFLPFLTHFLLFSFHFHLYWQTSVNPRNQQSVPLVLVHARKVRYEGFHFLLRDFSIRSLPALFQWFHDLVVQP